MKAAGCKHLLKNDTRRTHTHTHTASPSLGTADVFYIRRLHAYDYILLQYLAIRLSPIKRFFFASVQCYQ